jgi:hypothetical protein
MNAATDSPKTQTTVSDQGAEVPKRETLLASDHKVCLIEVSQMPYLPDQQVELLHLQAEADALLLQLQALQQKKQVKKAPLT